MVPVVVDVFVEENVQVARKMNRVGQLIEITLYSIFEVFQNSFQCFPKYIIMFSYMNCRKAKNNSMRKMKICQ